MSSRVDIGFRMSPESSYRTWDIEHLPMSSRHLRTFYWLILHLISVASAQYKIQMTRFANSNLPNSYLQQSNELKHPHSAHTHTHPIATSPTRNLHNAEEEVQAHTNDRRCCWSVLAPGQVLLWGSSAPFQQIYTQVLCAVRWWRRGVLELWGRTVAIFKQEEEENQDRTCNDCKARKNYCTETGWNWDPARRSVSIRAEGHEEIDSTTRTKQTHNHSMARNSNSRGHTVFIADKSKDCTRNWTCSWTWLWEQPRDGRGEANNFKSFKECELQPCRKTWWRECDAGHQD